ncbi:MAG: polysaccharide biosynthesis/export family protein [Deltaproteobacteria bacterium]|nr:polysaccharide biosynthesis/export family protein [Deltaproteobacteria bacterium]
MLYFRQIMNRKIIILALAMVFGSAGLFADRAHAADAGESYRIGPQDRLQITVWREADLTGEFEVSSQGVLQFPLLGQIKAAGRTTQSLDDEITRKLAESYLVDPIVTVSVASYRSQKVYVFGSVKRPGLFFLDEDPSILKVLLEAGGPEAGGTLTGDVVRLGDSPEREGGTPVEIRRVDLSALFTRGDLSQNLRLRSGDIVFVRTARDGGRGTANVVYITGAIQRPGAYEWNEDTTVLNVVLQAGGTTEYASANRSRVIRGQGPEREIFMVRVADILKGDKDKNLKLLPGDLITVPESFF